MTNRRDFLRKAALITAGVVAADQIEILERLTHQRRFFPSADIHRRYDVVTLRTVLRDGSQHSLSQRLDGPLWGPPRETFSIAVPPDASRADLIVECFRGDTRIGQYTSVVKDREGPLLNSTRARPGPMHRFAFVPTAALKTVELHAG